MTVTTEPTETRPGSDPTGVATPTVRATARRIAPWIGLVALALVMAVVIAAVTTGRDRPAESLAIDGVGRDGAGALVEVLRDRGVQVVGADSLAEAASAIDDAAATTILLFDRDGILSQDQRRELLGLADRLVVVQPDDVELDDLAPGVFASTDVLQIVRADCPIPAVQKAGTVDARGRGYQTEESSAAVGCLATSTG